MEYSAGLTSKLFWLQESRKTAAYILEGLSKADIRKIAWEENIYQVKAEYRAYEVLNGTYRRVSTLPEAVLQAFITCDVENAKMLNLIAILMDSRLFFEFLHEVYDEKIRLGEKEITDGDLNVFFADKAMQSAQYTIDNATSASEKSKATKAVTKYTKQFAKMKKAIAHIANQRIEINPDDGVKVNYEKFQGVEVARGGKKALKIDLLAKIE